MTSSSDARVVVIDAIEDRTARGIAAAISRLVTAGGVRPGERLPTVRDLARDLGVSPTTVSEAWQALAQLGVIEARGRAGTFVRSGSRVVAPRRYRRITDGPSHVTLDLATGTPDPELLPDLRPLLAKVSRQDLTHSYLDDPVLPALEEALRGQWPFEPEAMTVVDGAMDALDRLCVQLVRFGDRVLVENPCFPPLLDLLEQLGAEVIGMDLDDEGIVASSLHEGLAKAPVAMFLQPRAHNPAGVSMTRARAKCLASMLSGRRTVVIEDDHSGEISSSPAVSIGELLPEQTVLVRSFSKSHGPDLRMAAVGGPERLVLPLVRRRTLGPGWTSRVLQSVLALMLEDRKVLATVETARATYAERRANVVKLLDEAGVATTGTDGINLWVDVADEHFALLSLATHGLSAAPGSPFMVGPRREQSSADEHLRVTVGLVRGGYETVADRLAEAALGSGRPRRGRLG